MITKLQWFAEHPEPLLVSLWLTGTTILAVRQIRPKTLKDKIQATVGLAFIIFVFVLSVDALLSFFVIIFFPKNPPPPPKSMVHRSNGRDRILGPKGVDSLF